MNHALLKINLYELQKSFVAKVDFTKFLVGLVNRFLVIIDEYSRKIKGPGLILNKINLELLPLNEEKNILDLFLKQDEKIVE